MFTGELHPVSSHLLEARWTSSQTTQPVEQINRKTQPVRQINRQSNQTNKQTGQIFYQPITNRAKKSDCGKGWLQSKIELQESSGGLS